MMYSISKDLFERAMQLIPGGVNSPVRACRSVGTQPLFIERAEGCRLYDADGNRFVDYVGSWGPMILGHRHPAVIEALARALAQGTSFGAPTRLEVGCGRFDGFWEENLKPWDTAAGLLVAREAGARVTDYADHPFTFYDKQILATNTHIHQEMVDLLTIEDSQ